MHGINAQVLRQNMREFRLTVPTFLTLVRIAFIPVIVFFLYRQRVIWALSFFCAAAVTDVLDGYLARRLKQQTFLGACLDPVADKLLVAVLLATLWVLHAPFLPGWFVVLVLGKESIQIFGSTLIFLSKGNLFVCPVLLGKVSMFFQTCFIFALLLNYYLPLSPLLFSGLLKVCTFLVCASLGQYLFMGLKQFNA